MSLTKIVGDIVGSPLSLGELSVTGNVTFSNTRISANGGYGTSGQVLTTAGSGANVYWANAGGLGLGSRITAANTTSSIANGASGSIDLQGYKGYAVYKVQTSGAAWVRIYANASSRTADASRTEGTDPGTSAGVIAEVITTAANTISFTPAVIGFNDESTPTNTIPVAVMNKTGTTGTVTVTMTIVQLET